MEKNVTLSVNMNNRVASKTIFTRVNEAWTSFTQKAKMPVEWLRQYYSGILEKDVTLHQTWLLIKAQTAFLLGIFPADMPILLRVVFGAWMVYAFMQCKEAKL